MTSEIERIDSTARGGSWLDGADIVVLIEAEGSVGDVISRAKEVMRAVLSVEADSFTLEKAAVAVPEWFVNACAPERSPESRDRWQAWWRSLDAESRARAVAERRWKLLDWLYWLDPSERQWWWDAQVDSDTVARVAVQVSGWPTALEALRWLLKAAGATKVVVQD